MCKDVLQGFTFYSVGTKYWNLFLSVPVVRDKTPARECGALLKQSAVTLPDHY